MLKIYSTTLTEPIISFPTAELAMEKGFNYETCALYRINGKELELPSTPEEFAQYKNWNEYSDTLSAPTQAMLQKWLREVHGIDISVSPAGSKYICHYSHPKSAKTAGEVSEKKYEETLEQGLFESLKLIKTKQKK